MGPIVYTVDRTNNGLVMKQTPRGAMLTGKSGSVTLKPADGVWDISAFSYVRLDLTNAGDGLVWVRGRLDNDDAKDWANSAASEAFIMPGETATLGFPFQRGGYAYDGPKIFQSMSGKPNGHRTHWKGFNPRKVKACQLWVVSSSPTVKLTSIKFTTAWPYGTEANEQLEQLPYLDRFGQAIVFDYPEKVRSENELTKRHRAELIELKRKPAPESFNQYGGWADGPQLEATGFFRVTKHQGKWWLVDPAGKLFFSNGTNSTGGGAGTPLDGRETLFAWVPDEGDPLYPSAIWKNKKSTRIDFAQANLHRKFGDDWQAQHADYVHRRMRSWGLNTVGAWSLGRLYTDGRTAHTLIAHTWHPDDEKIADVGDPFAPGFAERIGKTLDGLAAKHRDDPWCVGVFIDNEIHWHGDLVDRIAKAPESLHARRELVGFMRRRGKSIDNMNGGDKRAFYSHYADTYYRACKEQLRRAMPNHLYLGSRVHHCPQEVSRAAAMHVDVFSINHYWPTAGNGSLPGDIDMPIMVTEFHFGTIDRGVLGVSLYGVHDQTQRARCYAAYVMSAALHPKVVGVHWFAYRDQSAVGRPGENYQFGFVDVTDTPYPSMIDASRRTAERIYPARLSTDASMLNLLKEDFTAARR